MKFCTNALLLLALLGISIGEQSTSPEKNIGYASSCPTCDLEYCPKTPQECAHGLVRDECGCCKEGVCVLKEKEKCLNLKLFKNITETDMKKLSVCDEYLECTLRTDLKAGEANRVGERQQTPPSVTYGSPYLTVNSAGWYSLTTLTLHRRPSKATHEQANCPPSACNFSDDQKDWLGEVEESVCKCQTVEVSCGKDNATYPSICQLKQAGTELKHSGPCTNAPEIISEPEMTTLLEHERFSLNCEAKGFPVPNVYWEFEGLNGLFKSLPGDDHSTAVHSRGGPEPFTVTSWVMIESLRQSDAGTYICVARNSEGVSRAVASVHVIKKNP